MLAVSSENIGVFVAFGGGIVSLLSPCVLPMVPGYLSMVSGLSVAELEAGERANLGRIAVTTGLFTLGFGSVFTVLGLAASGIGQAAFDNQETLTRVSGVIVMVMALYLVGSQVLRAPRLYPEKRFQVTRRFGWATAPIIGAAFGFGWSPCLGPVLAAVFGVAATQTSARAVALLVVVLRGDGRRRSWRSGSRSARRRARWRCCAGTSARSRSSPPTVLFAFGLVLALDRMSWLTARFTDVLDSLGLSRLIELG